MRPTARRLAAPLLLVAHVGLAACGDGGAGARGADATREAAAPTTTVAPEPTATTLAPAPASREAGLVVPDGDTAGLPLVVVLHGFGGSGSQVRQSTGLEAAATARGTRAVFAFPDGTGDDGFPRSWNAGGCCPFANLDAVPDVDWLATLIDDATRRLGLDPRRVVVAGHSNGGMMAYRLACERPDVVRAIVVGAGALMVPSCAPTSPVTVLHLHGALDTVVPLEGGATSGIAFPSAARSAGDYARAAGCGGAAPSWTCADGATVELVVGPSWSHDWQPEWTTRTLELVEALAVG
ncbi:MAG: hypothetical protein RL283_1561 [Actinomycetota bacterium]